MYFVLYNQNLKSKGTYILESWSRTQRAVDFDEIHLVGEKIPYSANPVIVVVNDKRGKMLFSGLASTPSIDDKQQKTSLVLKDYATLFNSEIIVDWDMVNTSSVANYLESLTDFWFNQIQIGFSVRIGFSDELYEIPLELDTIPSGKENILLKDYIFDAINYYTLYYTTELDIYNKRLTFVFYPAAVNSLSIKLKDFGVPMIEKSFGEYNQATVYSSSFGKLQEWALTENNSVVKLPSGDTLVYPTKNRNFISDGDDKKAVYEAVMGLASNRYQENIDLDAQKNKSIIDLSQINFSHRFSVYTDEGYYRDLPVGEIETNSKGSHIIRLGHRIQELTQEL